jgi:hypothetical protein
MPITSNYKDLFRNPTTVDKLTLFQSLLDVDGLTVDLSLAMLKSIHKELAVHQNRDRSGYKRYAQTIELLRYHMADMLQGVVDAWDTRGITAPMEWFSQKDR